MHFWYPEVFCSIQQQSMEKKCLKVSVQHIDILEYYLKFYFDKHVLIGGLSWKDKLEDG